MKKIIHFSDLHLGHKDLTRTFNDMVDRLIYLHTPAKDYVVIITGDIVDDVTKEEQLDDAGIQLQRIRKAGFHLLIAPGNHDYGTGSNATKEGMAKFKKHIYGDENAPFPRFQLIGNTAFIGLDSMQAEVNKGEGAFADGKLGKKQLRKLSELLSSDQVQQCQYKVVYLHHHPIDMGGFFKRIFHGLNDAKKLKKIIKAHTINALLFGHNHDGKPWLGSWGVERVYDAGSSTGKREGQGPHRIMDLSQHPSTDFDAKL